MFFQPFESQSIGSGKIECCQLVNIDPAKRRPGINRRFRRELAEKEGKLHPAMIVTMINPGQQLLWCDSQPRLFETFSNSTIRGAFLFQTFSARKLMFSPQDRLWVTNPDKKASVALNESNPDPDDRFWRDSAAHELVIVFRHRAFPVSCPLAAAFAGHLSRWPYR